jgi:ATP-dependent helicase HepA
MTLAFVKGDEVTLRARPESGVGVVTGVITAGDHPQYKVAFPSGTQMYSARSLAIAAEAEGASDDPVELLAAGVLADAESFRAYMSLTKLEAPLTDNLYSFAASRTERLPHQFKAVLKLLANPYGRLLIADEVGLGKTIEAGIILTELGARSPLDHVLVACPSPLTEKWRREMRDRFLLDFTVLDGKGFRDFVAADAEGPTPEPRRVIASLQLMRRAENIEALGTYAPKLDVVIVDEAHHMRNAGTATNELGEVLTRLAETAIFLTATPLNLGRLDFFELMRLLVPEEFPEHETFERLIEPNRHLNLTLRHLRSASPPPFREALEELRNVEATSVGARFARSDRYRMTVGTLERGARGEAVDRDDVMRCQRDLIELNTLAHVFTRTRKREVQELFPTRRSHTVGVVFTAAEHAFYDAVTDWALATYDDRVAHLVATTYQRLAASCLPALGKRLLESVASGRLSVGADELAEIIDTEFAVDIDAEDVGITDLGQVELDITGERSAVDRLVTAWQGYRGDVDSKYEQFAEALTSSFNEGAERILVFSYFTGTIDYLAERLKGVEVAGRRLEVVKLYGPMASDQRDRAVNRFRESPGPVVLLSSEVGSEGLDFQFCSRMFNYDLPWNPMRVEQRIGRLDRYGQTSELIHILNMIVSDTVEERIFYRLYERIRIFESSIGDLEAILGDVEFDLARLQRDALYGSLTDAELDRRRNLIADVIVRRQQDDDAFEAESRQFLSNDDVFLELFNDIERSRRYVTPEELQLLFERYLSVCGCDVRLLRVGRAGVFRLEGDVGTFRVQLMRALSRNAQGAKTTRAFIGRLSDHGLDLTFDPAIATTQRQLEFVSLHHPIIRALSGSADLRAQLSACGAIEVDVEFDAAGAHPFFVFELKAQGLKDELEHLAVVVAADGLVDEAASRNLLASLDTANSANPEPLGADVINRCYGAALNWVAALVAQREQQLQARADELITAQSESLRLTVDRRRLWLNEQIQQGHAVPIVRMRRAQLSRLDTETAAKLETLASRRGVSVGYRLVAAGVASSSGG